MSNGQYLVAFNIKEGWGMPRDRKYERVLGLGTDDCAEWKTGDKVLLVFRSFSKSFESYKYDEQDMDLSALGKSDWFYNANGEIRGKTTGNYPLHPDARTRAGGSKT